MWAFHNIFIMNFETPVYLSGHAGMLGKAVLRNLENAGYKNLIHARRAELDLTDQRRF